MNVVSADFDMSWLIYELYVEYKLTNRFTAVDAFKVVGIYRKSLHPCIDVERKWDQAYWIMLPPIEFYCAASQTTQ